MLKCFFLPEVKRFKQVRLIIFQQDSAPSQFATDVRQFLNQQFPNCCIGRGGPDRWAPRAPDLTPLDFFVGTCKGQNLQNSDERYVRLERKNCERN